AAVLHDQDLLGAAYGGKTVRDNEGGAAAHQVTQPLLNERLRFGIKTGRSFVENQDARVGQDGAGDGDALLLAAGKLHAAFPDHGVVFLLERFREFIHTRDAAGRKDLFLGGVGPGVGDVFANGAVEQKRLLQHHAQLRAIGAEANSRKVGAIHQDA